MKKTINQLKSRVEVECAKRGWSLTHFASLIGRSPQALNDMLKRDNARLDTIKDMADALGMTMEAFSEPVSVAEYGATLIPRKG